jgi:1-acyl-sn-glycerol-3-phosphate acyltransferase
MQNETVPADSHKTHLPQTQKFEIGKDYKYISNNPFFLFFSFLFKYLIIYPVFFTITKVVLGYKVVGRSNIKKLDGGTVTVSNHVHVLDAPMISFSLFPKQPRITSIKGNFQTPGVSFLVKVLGAVPIPETPNELKEFFDAMTKEVNRGGIVHFYPEAALWPGFTEIRPFKKGAFHLAASADVQVLPMLIKQREPKGVFRLYKKKPCITVIIGEPIKANKDLSSKQSVLDIRQRTHDAITKLLEV